MKCFVWLFSFAMLVTAAAWGDEPKETPEYLFQKALHLETAKADYQGAIPVYETIIGENTTAAVFAVKALIRLGICYEKAGNPDKAAECKRQLEPLYSSSELGQLIDMAAGVEGNFWEKYGLWEKLSGGKDGKKSATKVQADRLLSQLIKGVYLVRFEPKGTANPKTPGEFLALFNKTSSLRSEKDRLGGASFFRTTRVNGKLAASFLTEYPDRMKQDIEKNPELKFISAEEVSADKFIAHVRSAQESL